LLTRGVDNQIKRNNRRYLGKFYFIKRQRCKIGHKSANSFFFGYKIHLAITEEHIITAAVITSGEKGDANYPDLPSRR